MTEEESSTSDFDPLVNLNLN